MIVSLISDSKVSPLSFLSFLVLSPSLSLSRCISLLSQTSFLCYLTLLILLSVSPPLTQISLSDATTHRYNPFVIILHMNQISLCHFLGSNNIKSFLPKLTVLTDPQITTLIDKLNATDKLGLVTHLSQTITTFVANFWNASQIRRAPNVSVNNDAISLVLKTFLSMSLK